MEKSQIHELLNKTKNLRLLYVEDDSTISAVTFKLLKRIFDNVHFCENGEKALEEFKNNNIDLIISDISMPIMSGIEMLKHIRQLDTDVPIIFTTAHGESSYYQSSIDLNVHSYLLKPMDLNTLLKKIEEIVNTINSKVKKEQNFQNIQNTNEKLIAIANKISTEKDYNSILESILLGAKELSSADGGTLYFCNKEEKSLEFKIAINTSLDIHIGGTKDKTTWPSLKLYDENGNPNMRNISAVCAIKNEQICIDDIYESEQFEFKGTKKFDEDNNYRTSSMLVVPLNDRENNLVGVIQLINKNENGEFVKFNEADISLVKSMAALSTMTLDNNKLVNDLESLLYALVESIGTALGEKSAYTGRHVDHVAEISLNIADAINKDDTTFKDTSFTQEELEEIKLAAWLHDIGKITTPEYIVDKATRLETIFDRLEFVEAKIELLKKDFEIEFLKNNISKEEMEKNIKQLEDDIVFIKDINSGDVFMSDDKQEKLDDILNRNEIEINNKKHPILTKDEHYNLSIKKGTLTDEERDIINNHVSVSYSMLKRLPFPKKYQNVPTIAGSHHKTVDGKGYAHRDIMNKPMNVAEKILAVADIFEALSAHDRPYRGPNTIGQIAKILGFMVKDKHLDEDIVKLFLEKKIYQSYVDKYFLEDQIDEVVL